MLWVGSYDPHYLIYNLVLQLLSTYLMAILCKASKLFRLACGIHSEQTNISGQIITTSADVTLNGGLIRELPQNPLNSGLGIILICPDIYIYNI